MMTSTRALPCALVGFFCLLPTCIAKTPTSSADEECNSVTDKELIQSSGRVKQTIVESNKAGSGWDMEAAANPKKCIDIPGGHVWNTQKVSIWDCNKQNPQSFEYWGDHTLRYAADTSYCIDIAAVQCKDGANKGKWVCFAKGAKVQLYKCHGGLNQQFVFDGVDKDVSAGIKAHYTKLCITDETKKYDNNAELTMQDCGEESANLFKIPALLGSQLRPVSYIGTGKKMCLDAANNEVKDGVRMLLWDCLLEQGALLQKNQNFYYNEADSTIRFTRVPNMCLDVDASKFGVNGTVQVWKCHGKENQQWTLKDNQVKMKIKDGSELCLGDPEKTNKQNADMKLTECSAVQSFAFRGLETMKVPWERGTTSAKYPTCGDGTNNAGWSCVSRGHGQRLQCPFDHPTMCAEKTCGGNQDFCCMPPELTCDKGKRAN